MRHYLYGALIFKMNFISLNPFKKIDIDHCITYEYYKKIFTEYYETYPLIINNKYYNDYDIDKLLIKMIDNKNEKNDDQIYEIYKTLYEYDKHIRKYIKKHYLYQWCTHNKLNTFNDNFIIYFNKNENINNIINAYTSNLLYDYSNLLYYISRFKDIEMLLTYYSHTFYHNDYYNYDSDIIIFNNWNKRKKIISNNEELLYTLEFNNKITLDQKIEDIIVEIKYYYDIELFPLLKCNEDNKLFELTKTF